MADLFQCWLYWNIYDKNGAFLREYFFGWMKSKITNSQILMWTEYEENGLVIPNSYILGLLLNHIIESTIGTTVTVENL